MPGIDLIDFNNIFNSILLSKYLSHKRSINLSTLSFLVISIRHLKNKGSPNFSLLSIKSKVIWSAISVSFLNIILSFIKSFKNCFISSKFVFIPP